MLLKLFLLVVILNVKTLFGGALQLLAIEFFELLDGVLIDGVHHVEDLETLLAEGLKERRRGDASNAFTSDVINVVLTLLHAINILLEANLLIARLGGVIAQELSNLHPVGGVFMDAKFDVLGELLVKLLVVIFFSRRSQRTSQGTSLPSSF